MNAVTSTGTAAHPARSPRSARGTRPGTDTPAVPPAGQPGHGLNARLRRQPVRIVDGRIEGGYTDAFEVICPDCGDHPVPGLRRGDTPAPAPARAPHAGGGPGGV